MRLAALFRQKRPLEVEQLTGLTMLIASALIFLYPSTVSLDWLAAILGVPILTHLFILGYGFCGYILALLTDVHGIVFALLSSPILFSAVLIFSYTSLHNQSPVIPFLLASFWSMLQSFHTQRQEVKRWSKHSILS